MAKKHLKTIAMPKSWPLNRKDLKYVSRPMPGSHAFENGMSISVFIRILGYANTTAEIKKIIREKDVLVDGRKVKDIKKIVGLMDLIEFPELKKKFRVLIDEKGKLKLVETDESIKPVKIIGKRTIGKGKTQLNLHDGRNILKDKPEYSVGDVLMIKVPSQEITKVYTLEKGVVAYLVQGSHKGRTGVVEEIKDGRLTLKIDKESVETQKRFAFAIGKEKSDIKTEDK